MHFLRLPLVINVLKNLLGKSGGKKEKKIFFSSTMDTNEEFGVMPAFLHPLNIRKKTWGEYGKLNVFFFYHSVRNGK